MTTPRPPRHAHADLDRLIEAGSRIRSLREGERSALFERVERRKTKSDRARRFVAASAGLAALLALGAFTLSFDGITGSNDVTAKNAAASGRESAVDTELGASAALPAPAPVAPPPAAAAPGAQPPPSGASTPADGARPPLRRLSLGGRGELELDAEASVIMPSPSELAAHHPLRIRLDRGQVRASVGPRAPDEPFAIATPHLQVTVVGTRFLVSVDPAGTTVAVEHGRVLVESAGRSLLLDAGQTIRSDDAQLRPAPRTARPNQEACSAADPPRRRRDCLARMAAGKGLAAQNALLSLGLLERDELGDRAAALARFREYERRHPHGVLAPEVALALVQTLMLERQPALARAAVDDYARRFPDDAVTTQRLRALAAGAS
jgi:ferric-dicitrate binding protein FerR (iron transport regulator)